MVRNAVRRGRLIDSCWFFIVCKSWKRKPRLPLMAYRSVSSLDNGVSAKGAVTVVLQPQCDAGMMEDMVAFFCLGPAHRFAHLVLLKAYRAAIVHLMCCICVNTLYVAFNADATNIDASMHAFLATMISRLHQRLVIIVIILIIAIVIVIVFVLFLGFPTRVHWKGGQLRIQARTLLENHGIETCLDQILATHM